MASAFGQFIVMIEKCVAAEPPQATYVYKKKRRIRIVAVPPLQGIWHSRHFIERAT